MSTIPADITEAAKSAYIEASRAKKKPLDPFDIVAAVARAILAERERCARIVEGPEVLFNAIAIAAAIRKGDHIT